MNTNLNISSHCYGLFNQKNEQVAFIAVKHMPHPQNRKIKAIHRFVVLPDYQGIGIGGAFLDRIAQIYKKDGYDVRIVTSAKNLICKLKKQNNWKAVHYGIITGGIKSEKPALTKTHRKVKTASFKFMEL